MILFGMALTGGMISSFEFGFLSYKWLITLFYFCFGIFVAMLYMIELNKRK